MKCYIFGLFCVTTAYLSCPYCLFYLSIAMLDANGFISLTTKVEDFIILMTRAMKLEYQLLCLYVLTNYCTEACLHHFADVDGLSVILRWFKLGLDIDSLSLLGGVLAFFSALPMDQKIIAFIKTHKVGGKINKLLKHADVDIIRSAQKAKDCIQEKVGLFAAQSQVLATRAGTTAAAHSKNGATDIGTARPEVIIDIDRYLRTVKMDVAKPSPKSAIVELTSKESEVVSGQAPESEPQVEEAAEMQVAETLSVPRSVAKVPIRSTAAPINNEVKDAPSKIAPSVRISTTSDATAPAATSTLSFIVPNPAPLSPSLPLAAVDKKLPGLTSPVSTKGPITGSAEDVAEEDEDDDDSVISFTGFNKFKRTTVSMGASLAQHSISMSDNANATVLPPAHSRTAVPGRSILKKTVPVAITDFDTNANKPVADAGNALDAALVSPIDGMKVKVTSRSIFWADQGSKSGATPKTSTSSSSPSAATSANPTGELTKVYTYEIDTLFRRKIAGYQSTKEREKSERLRMKEDAKKKFVMVADLTAAEWERPKVLLLPSLSDDGPEAWESAFAIPETDSDCKIKENLRLKTVLEERYYPSKPAPMDPARPVEPNSLKGPEHSQELVVIPFDIVTAGGEQNIPAPAPAIAHAPVLQQSFDTASQIPSIDMGGENNDGTDESDLAAMMEQLPELIRNLDSAILQHLIAHEDDLVGLLDPEDGSVDEQKVRDYVANFYAKRGGGGGGLSGGGGGSGVGGNYGRPIGADSSYGRRIESGAASYASINSGVGGGSYISSGGQKRERELCSYFNSHAGCMRGDDCRYMHVLGVAPKRQRR